MVKHETAYAACGAVRRSAAQCGALETSMSGYPWATTMAHHKAFQNRKSIYGTPRWRSLRLGILDRDLWTCRMCGVALRQGRRRPDSAVVDHIEPVELSPDLKWDEGNLQSVCRTCHAVCDSIEKRNTAPADIRAAKLAYKPVGLDGYPVRRA